MLTTDFVIVESHNQTLKEKLTRIYGTVLEGSKYSFTLLEFLLSSPNLALTPCQCLPESRV